MLFVMAMLALPLPSPGGAVLDDLWLSERLLLAQSSPEERELEKDMDSARRRLGHGDAPATQAKPDAPAPGVEQPTTPKVRAGTDNGVPRRRESRRRSPGVTLDGHGRAYYLTWGLVDWGIAGGMWLGGTYVSLFTIVLASAWNDNTMTPREQRDVRSGAVVTAGIAAGLTLGGIILARRAGHNIGTFRDLRAAGSAGLTGELPPRERDDEDDED